MPIYLKTAVSNDPFPVYRERQSLKIRTNVDPYYSSFSNAWVVDKSVFELHTFEAVTSDST